MEGTHKPLLEESRKLTWREACKFLGCGKTRFYGLIRKGFLPAYRIRGGNRGLWVYEKDCVALKERIAVNQ